MYRVLSVLKAVLATTNGRLLSLSLHVLVILVLVTTGNNAAGELMRITCSMQPLVRRGESSTKLVAFCNTSSVLGLLTTAIP